MSKVKLIDPKVELFSEENVTTEQHIARCARVCYGGEDKPHTEEQDEKLVNGLIKNKHLSMLRHASIYVDTHYINKDIIAAVPYSDYDIKHAILATNYQEYMYGLTRKELEYDRDYCALSNADMLDTIRKYNDINLILMYRLTFCITTQVATSRELNRKSPNNIAERSTRYCTSKDGLDICKPWWWDDNKTTKAMKDDYIYAMSVASQSYNDMLNMGFKPEDARGVLPLDTATKVIYTYSIKEWKEILDLRLYDKTGKAHPNCHVVMGMVRDQINQFLKDHDIKFEV